LHYVGQWLRDALLLIPLGVVRAMFVALPALLILWVISLPRASTTPGPDSRAVENLKLWAIIALMIQVIIYAVG
jgi:hypothetical protein